MAGVFDNIHPGLTCAEAYKILLAESGDLDSQSDFYMAVSHLINFPGTETESALLRFLERPSSETSIRHAQRKAIEVVARLDSHQAIATIGTFLDSDDIYMVENAAWALAQLNCQDHNLHMKVISLLDDLTQNTRILIQALAKLSVVNAVPSLLKLRDDPRPSVQGAAIAALVQLNGQAGDLGTLGKHLYLSNQMDRQSAVQDIIDSQAVGLLPEVMQAPISPAFKMRAFRCLLDLDNPLLYQPNWISMIDRVLLDQSSNIVVLHRYEDKLAPELLIQSLFHPDFSMCYLAMQSLQELNPETLWPLLRIKWESGAHNDYGAHYFFIQLFGQIKGWSEPALQCISDVLNDAIVDTRPQFRKSSPIAILSFARQFPALLSDLLTSLTSGQAKGSWQMRYATLLSIDMYCSPDIQIQYRQYVEDSAGSDSDAFVRTKATDLLEKMIANG
jgi:bilin biosynthesis protein